MLDGAIDIIADVLVGQHHWFGLHDWHTGGDVLRRCSLGLSGQRGTIRAAFRACAGRHAPRGSCRVGPSSPTCHTALILNLKPRVCVFNVAAEIAAARPDVRGPGTFRAALLDELYNLTPEVLRERVKLEVL